MQESSEPPLSEAPKFPRSFVRIEEGSTIPCKSKMSPTGMHFFATVQYRGAEKLMCRFCGTPALKAMATVEHTVVENPERFKILPSNEVEKIHPPEAKPAEPDESAIERIKSAIRGAMEEKPAGKELFEQQVSRARAEEVAAELTGEECRAYRRKIGKRKICVLHVEQGDGKTALLFEGADWWIVLRLLFSFLKNRGQLPGGEGGELVPA